MNPGWFEGLILGLVQGLTEFLPISSSGHLVLAEDILGFRPPGLYFEVGLHLATLLSVFVVYAGRIRELLSGLLRQDGEARHYVLMLVLASVPAAIAGLLFRDFFARTFESGVSLGLQFMATAAILWTVRPAVARAVAERVGPATALGIGVAQAVAILPAISRSGATIAAAVWAGIAPSKAAEFSFLLSILAIAGSGMLEARHIPPGADLLSPGLLTAFAAALLSGVWAIRFLVVLLRSQRFHAFAPYCLGIGIFTILWYTVIRP